MPYPRRVEIPGAYYHVVTRGNNQRTIFPDDWSRDLFSLMLDHVSRVYRWTILAYCFLDNHYHLVLQIDHPGLSRGMQELNGRYAIQFNAHHDRRDHLFGRRFWSEVLADQSYLLNACRYVDLNPWRTRDRVRPGDWRWSSYRAAVGQGPAARFHNVQELWQLFDRRPRTAIEIYERFVEEWM